MATFLKKCLILCFYCAVLLPRINKCTSILVPNTQLRLLTRGKPFWCVHLVVNKLTVLVISDQNLLNNLDSSHIHAFQIQNIHSFLCSLLDKQ